MTSLPAHLLIHSATIRKPVQSFAPGTKQPVFDYQDIAAGVPCRFDPRPTSEHRNVLGDVPKPGWTVFLNPTEVDANCLLLKEDDQSLYLVTSVKSFFDIYLELAAELKEMIRITLRDQGDVAGTLTALPQRLRGAVVQAFQDAAIQIQSLAKVNAPVFRGLLRVSIVQHVADEGSRIVGEVGSGLVYAHVMEEGRDQGWFPPPEALRDWARKKLGDERLAFVVARAISRRGFKAHPYLGPALEAVTPRVEAIFQARIAEALQGGGR